MRRWSTPLTGLAVFIASILVSLPLSGNVVDPTETEPYCQAMEAIDRVAGIVTEARQHIDRSTFDLDVQLDRLDYDAGAIIDFTRRSIVFEPYAGTLRGPRGTLISRAGNSLDQALLLGKLLRDAGYEARIARAQLGREATTALLQEITLATPRRPSTVQQEVLAAALARLGGNTVSDADILDKLQKADDPRQDQNYQEVLETAGFLLDQLESANVEISGTEGNDDTLIVESSDYFWVQYRDAVSDGWHDAHPAFANDPPASLPAPSAFIADSIPAELQHRFRFQLFIERRMGDSLEVIPISRAWERPVANLVDIPLTFSIFPNSTTIDTVMEGRYVDALKTATYFVPLFNGEIAAEARYFDLQGNIIDPMAASDPGAGVFAKVGKSFGHAAGALGAVLPKLTAQWVELTLITPGGDERVWRRTTLDLIGPAARASGKAPDTLDDAKAEDASDLLRMHTIMVTAGDTPGDLVLDRSFEEFLQGRAAYQQLIDQLVYRAFDELEPPEMTVAEVFPGNWPGHLGLLSLFDRAGFLAESHRTYRASPGVIMHVKGPRVNGGEFEMVDIVTNARRSVALGGSAPRVDPKAAIVTGVWDTAQEGALLRPGDTRTNTETAFRMALADGRKVAVLAPNKPIKGMTLAPDIKAAVQADLSRGFAVVIPDGQINAKRAGWWRIHPETGETVGQATDGRGQDLVEYRATQQPAFKISAAFLAGGLGLCAVDLYTCGGSDLSCMAQAACCGTWSMVGFVLGLGIVSQIGAAAWDAIAFHLPVCG